MTEQTHLHAGNTDWREQIKKNQRRTRFVILMYFAIYIAIGLLVDLALYSDKTNLPLDAIFLNLITLKFFPIATCVTIFIALISLWITYVFSDRLMLLGTEYHEITAENSQNLAEKQLYNVVEEMKVAAGLQFMPRVYIIDADYMNAFASGFSEKSAMVAITRGLMEKLDRAELQAVMAHELSHVRHQDIKLTLTASVLSNLMLIIVDLLFYNLMFSGGGDRKKNGSQLFIIIMLLRYLLPVITVLLMLYLSRTREYMADSGCVELMRDNTPLARALIKINEDHQNNKDRYSQAYGQTAHEDVRRAAYIYDPVKSGVEPVHNISSMFSTHPTLQERLAAIGVKTQD